MKDRKFAEMDTPGQRCLPGRVTELMEKILESWKQMDSLLQAEWKAVLKGEFSSLYRFSRGKEILADHILNHEKELKDTILADILPEGQNHSSEALLSLLLRGLSSCDRQQVMSFHASRANLKMQVAITNRRTMMWVRERMEFSSELLEILTGNRLRRSATYGPPGKSIIYRKGAGFDILDRKARKQASSRGTVSDSYYTASALSEG